MSAMKAPEDLLRKIRQGNRFLLVSHANPDGDAIGSELALARLLRGMGKGAAVWNRDPLPTVYKALPGSERIHVGTEPPAGFPEKFDAIIVLECPSPDRTGLEEHFGALPVLNIDHHLGNQHYGAINWVEPAAPAVGEMVYRIAQALHLTLDPETASCLYLTLVTDTGGFRFANSTPAAFEAAASLVKDGAQPEQVSLWLYESQPLGAVRLLGEMLRSLEVHAEGKVATALLTLEMFERAGAAQGDSEGLIDHIRSVAGVEAAGLLRERPDGVCKVSVRSRGDIDVEKIARRNGGGGHRNASGYTLEGSLATLREGVAADLAAAVAAPALAQE